MKISEIFHSIQGESSCAGIPTVFVRLTGCSLRCVWCDSQYAFYGGTEMSVDAIIQRVRGYDCRTVEITGGEPLDQSDVLMLMERLLAEGFRVMIETSGTKDIGRIPNGVHIIMDIKCPASGMSGHNRWENLSRLREDTELKFVIKDRKDYDWSKGILQKYLLADRNVIFSPVHGELIYKTLVEWILEDRLPVRFQLQMHKVIGVA